MLRRRNLLVALPADLRVVARPMRVVTSLTRQLAAAREVAARLAQPVCRTHDFKFALVSGAWRVIEVQHEAAQRLVGTIRIGSALEALDLRGKAAAGGLEMALHTDLHLPVRRKAGWIQNGRANRLFRRARRLRQLHVIGSRTMAALAINPFRQAIAKNEFAVGCFMCGDLRIAIVAEHAVIADFAARVRRGGIVARIHGEMAALFRVPGEWQFDQRAARRAMQISAHPAARAHDVIDAQLFHVLFPALVPELPSALIKLAVAHQHRVVGCGCLVEKTARRRILFVWAIESVCHARVLIAARGGRVTALALTRIRVGRCTLLRSMLGATGNHSQRYGHDNEDNRPPVGQTIVLGGLPARGAGQYPPLARPVEQAFGLRCLPPRPARHNTG